MQGSRAVPQEEGGVLAVGELILTQLILSYGKCNSKQDTGSPQLAFSERECLWEKVPSKEIGSALWRFGGFDPPSRSPPNSRISYSLRARCISDHCSSQPW